MFIANSTQYYRYFINWNVYKIIATRKFFWLQSILDKFIREERRYSQNLFLTKQRHIVSLFVSSHLVSIRENCYQFIIYKRKLESIFFFIFSKKPCHKSECLVYIYKVRSYRNKRTDAVVVMQDKWKFSVEFTTRASRRKLKKAAK